ncbi:MAG: hypothetical protein AAGK04_04715 [Planctomycetota bacterium]
MKQHISIAIALMASAGLAAAQTSITDGFGDGDRDNDGSLDGPLTDASDVGINWYSVGGTTSGGDPKPELTVADDAGGINSGNALFSQSRGSNAELAGFFGSQVSLGSNIGDTMTLSFDLRLNAASEPLTDLSDSAELRFGLYTDSDNELGTGGWGTSDGDFDSGSSSPGVGGDSGFFFRTPINDAAPASFASRIIYEPNNPDNIAGGSGTETIRVEDDFGGIYDELSHNIEVTFERILGAPGEDLLITFAIDGVSFSDTTVGEGLPLGDLASFDYFVIMMSQDMDYAIDNFSLTTTAIPAPGVAAVMGLAGLAGVRRRR